MNADERRFVVPGVYQRGLAAGAEGGDAPVEAPGEEVLVIITRLP